MSHVVECPGVDAHLICRRVNLRADAVVLVVSECLRAEHGHDLIGILFRLGQHEGEGMEEIHSRGCQRVTPGKQRRCTDIAGQHVRAAHRRERPVERLCDRAFDQPLLQSDPKLAKQDLQHEADALCVEFPQQCNENGFFVDRSGRRG